MNPIIETIGVAIRYCRECANRFICRIHLIAQIRRERDQLNGLDERELLDMGIDKQSACQESHRELLDIPPNRLLHSSSPDSSHAAASVKVPGHSTSGAL